MSLAIRLMALEPSVMATSVYRALRPVLIYSRIVGIYPQSRDHNHRAVFYTYFCLYCTLVFVCSGSALLWLQLKDPEWYNSIIHLIIEKSQVVIVFANYSVALITALREYKTFQSILKGLHYADKQLMSTGIRIRYKIKNVVRVLVFRVVFQITLFFLDLYLNWNDALKYLMFDVISTYLPLFSVTGQQLQAYAFLKFIGNHFSVMASRLEELQSLSNLDHVLCFLRVYDALKEMALSVNKCFSLNTIFSLTSIFFYVIVTLHLVATHGIIHSGFTFLLYVFCLGFVMLKLYELWNIVEPFVYVTNQVEIFNAALFKLMVNDKVGKLSGNEKLQLHIAVKQGIVFTASGFFNLDYSLIQSMAGAIATFLVILVQFDISSPQEKPLNNTNVQ